MYEELMRRLSFEAESKKDEEPEAASPSFETSFASSDMKAGELLPSCIPVSVPTQEPL